MSSVRAKKRYGQHFLESAWADKLVAAIAPAREDRFLEIGPGPGALTLRLAVRTATIVAIEVDPEMVAVLRPKVPANVTLVEHDVLEADLGSLVGDTPTRVAGNLPYNVASPILFKLLAAYTAGVPLRDATLMLQREVAERLEASPGTKDYGLLSIFVQRQAVVRRVLTLPPGAFRPPPKVTSAVVRLEFRPSPVTIRDEEVFAGLVRSIFTRRRKTLNNALAPFAGERGVSAHDVIRAAGIDGTRRPETLQLAELARLADYFVSPQKRAVL